MKISQYNPLLIHRTRRFAVFATLANFWKRVVGETGAKLECIKIPSLKTKLFNNFLLH